MSLNRKTALAAVCSAVLAFTTACGSGDASSAGPKDDDLAGDQLVYVNFGGDTLTAAQKAWLDPFAAESGARFATDSPSDPAKVKAMVDAGNTTWDLIDLDVGSGGAGCGTLYEKRSADVDISNIDPQYISDECGVPIMVQTIALVYNKKLFGDNPPTSITDFMDTETYPGRRITLNYATGALEGLLLADGVAADQLYPLDMDRAASAVKKLGSDLSLDASMAQEQAALESGDFAMCWCYTGRAALSAERGANLGVLWGTTYSGWDAVYAVKGSKFPDAQQKFLNYIAQPEPQAAFTEELPYGPTTPASKPDVSGDRGEWLPATNADKTDAAAFYDATWWNANADDAFAAWTEMTAG